MPETTDKNRILERITVNPRVMVGKPVIRGTRLTVQYVVGLLGAGATMEEILTEYPGLTREDIRACLTFAAEAMDATSILPVHVEAP